MMLEKMKLAFENEEKSHIFKIKQFCDKKGTELDPIFSRILIHASQQQTPLSAILDYGLHDNDYLLVSLEIILCISYIQKK